VAAERFTKCQNDGPDVRKLGTKIIGEYQFPSHFIGDGRRCPVSVNLDELLGRTIVAVGIDTWCRISGTLITNPKYRRADRAIS
jgi:hypothetical protein